MGLVVYGIFDTWVSLYNAVQDPSSKVALPHGFVLSSPLPHTVAPFRQNGQGLVSPPPSVLGTCHLALLPYILAAFPFSSVVRLFYITFSFFDILPVCDHLDIAFVPLLALIVPLIYAWRVFFTSLVLYHILYALWLQTECMFCIFLVNLTGWPYYGVSAGLVPFSMCLINSLCSHPCLSHILSF